ncbi:O-antigen ligase family protein [Vulgatibacter incomptus]|uniref:O-antigen ligase domain-containing protein n=1 Tax=Vulgatibacter incomptus TaxID=1391653 RepID=A0A0K1PCF6_9BACT|nr:O-antigen ligase family protein [Vulgatibacter incomptus]AKU91106.1 hypothetical protein AKJ08_1493 [Vulgatibacter incomptus]
MEILANASKITVGPRLRLALDASLASCALAIGGGLPFAWAVVVPAALFALAARPYRPTALGKPYALFGLAFGVGTLIAPGASLTAAHAWAMGRPGVAIPLTGAVRDGSRAFRLAVLFVFAVGLRAIVELVGSRPESFPITFLSTAALVLLAASWLVGAGGGRARIVGAVAALPVALVTWRAGSPTAWLALAGAVATMAILGRRPLRAAPILLAALGLSWASAVVFAPSTPGDSGQGLGFLWSRTLEALAREPIGIGAGNFAARTGEALAAQGLEPQDHPRNSLLAVWTEHGPLGLVAAFWLYCASFAALRRGWKGLPEADSAARSIVLGAAGAVGLLLAWSFDHEPLSEPLIGFALGFLLSLGLAAAGEAALPSAEEGLLYDGGSAPEERARKAAAGAALAIAGAALGGTASLGLVTPALARASLWLLAALVALHLPWFGGSLARSLRGLIVFVGAAILATRPFTAALAPGSAEWWRSASAGAALCGLGAAIAGAGHAIRRPGRIGPAPVAGALCCLGVLGFVGSLDYGVVRDFAAGFEPLLSYNFAVAACLVSMLFVAWSGPLSFGEADLQGRARHLARLPAAAVAVGLAAVAMAGLR